MTYIAQEVYSIIPMFQTHVTHARFSRIVCFLKKLRDLVTVSVSGMLKQKL